MTLTVGILVGILILSVAFIASFARPQSAECDLALTQSAVQDLITNSTDINRMDNNNNNNYNNNNSASLEETTDSNTWWNSIRLPRNILPQHYKILIHPNLTTSLVTGDVTITCKVVSSTDFIILHNTQNITELVIHGRNSSNIRSVDVVQEKSNNRLYIKLDRHLNPDEIIDIIIYFRSHLKSSLVGFYLSSYTADDGSTRYLATTQFEPNFARTAFPCFDEPDMKANFTLLMVREERHNTLFNMPLQKTKPYIHGLFLDTFYTTPKMSTYLVSFIVSDFVSVTGISKSGVK
ncbi:hypothetical protein Ahia01_000385600, partial [Argonauta hians]